MNIDNDACIQHVECSMPFYGYAKAGIERYIRMQPLQHVDYALASGTCALELELVSRVKKAYG